jgi:hypothetical protein
LFAGLAGLGARFGGGRILVFFGLPAAQRLILAPIVHPAVHQQDLMAADARVPLLNTAEKQRRRVV